MPVKFSIRSWRAAALALTLASATAGLAGASPSDKAGDLDRSFSHNGKVVTDFRRHASEAATDVTIDSHGRAIAVGYARGSHDNFTGARYTEDGSLDRHFSGNGKITTIRGSTATSVAVGANDGVVIAGGDRYLSHLSIARYTADGHLDSRFSQDGKLESKSLPGATAVAVDRKNRILLVGMDQRTPKGPLPKPAIGVTRLLPNGQRDTSFGEDGHVSTEIDGYAYPNDVTVDARGRVIVAGDDQDVDTAANKTFVARYGRSGNLDSSFANGGIFTSGFGEDSTHVSGVALSGGEILIAGKRVTPNNYFETFVARLTPSGDVDPSFGEDGYVTSGFKGTNAWADDVAVDSRRRIVLAGGARIHTGNDGHDSLVVRYSRGGKLDRSFSGDGKSVVDVSSSDGANAVAVDGRNRIIAAGESGYDPRGTRRESRFALFRLRN